MKNMKQLLLVLLAIVSISSCKNPETPEKKEQVKKGKDKTAVLIVSHGSPSETWQNTLIEVGNTVKPEILKNKNVSDVRTAFMEFATPSIAEQLKSLDEEGFDHIIIVPLFLTVSSHTESDIQNIVGLKSDQEKINELTAEGVEIYKPKAEITITPLLDFSGYLRNNIVRRYNEISEDHNNEGIVMIAYGSQYYNTEWTQLMDEIVSHLQDATGVEQVNYAWCGHIVNFSSEPAQQAIEECLGVKDKAVVIPVLVAVDENFQGKRILNAVQAIENNEEKVIYRQDAILPDNNINQWIIDIVNTTLDNRSDR